jgi:DNA-binding response OmpR family regulator
LQPRLAHTSEPPPRLVAKMEIKNIDDDNKKRILIIDDEVDITFTFKVGLEDTGSFTVDTFNDPQDLLLNFQPVMYDLLLLDIRMPKMSGYELYKEIRKIDAKIKVIFLTATEPFEEFQKVFPTFDKKYYLMKPIEITELIKRINE